MNRIQAANDALWDLVRTAFAVSDPIRNPSTHQAPKPRSGGLSAYVALSDDREPEVIAAFAGSAYDLQAQPVLTLAFVGGAKDARNVAAWDEVEALKLAISIDVTLGGVVEHTQVSLPQELAADEADWLAGGLEVPVRLLFNAPTQAG